MPNITAGLRQYNTKTYTEKCTCTFKINFKVFEKQNTEKCYFSQHIPLDELEISTSVRLRKLQKVLLLEPYHSDIVSVCERNSFQSSVTLCDTTKEFGNKI